MRLSLLLLLATAAAAQPAAFEAASIKPAPPAQPGRIPGNRVIGNRIDYNSATLRACISFAYEVKDYEIFGPAWLADARWQILAKAPDTATAGQLPQMMRTLLAERFGLAVHRETRELDGWALIVAKDGPSLKRAETPGGFRTGVRPGGGGTIEADGMSMELLATLLTRTLGRPVADQTGLTGIYKFTLEYASYDGPGPMRFVVTSGDLPHAPESDSGVSVFTSIQKLGLRLERRKIPSEVVVIDHAEKTPTAN